jgi:phage terminase large subunit
MKDWIGGDSNAEPSLIQQPSLDFPEVAEFLLSERARFKCLYGGRGGGKSWAMARALIAVAHTGMWPGSQENDRPWKHLILCAREYQNSINDSVYRLLINQIEELQLTQYFTIQRDVIRSLCTGSEFIFKGLHHSIAEIKSLEGVTICWVEEAHGTSAESWRTLIPTIRSTERITKAGHTTEIWVSFNPDQEKDPTSQRFIINPEWMGKRGIVRMMNWDDNIWFPEDMEEDRLALLKSDPEAYEHVYMGAFLSMTNATIMRGNYIVMPFEEPERVDRIFLGLDFGFAESPNFATRSYIHDNMLYVTHEAHGRNVEIDDLPTFLDGGVSKKTGRIFQGMPGVRNWPMKGDAARPETISYLRRKGFNIEPAKKWAGSVDDGIAHLKGFKKIIIHERCVQLAQEARLYSFKKDRKTEEVLPIVEDKHNHGWDSLRYALDGYIQARGRSGVWARLATPGRGNPLGRQIL